MQGGTQCASPIPHSPHRLLWRKGQVSWSDVLPVPMTHHVMSFGGSLTAQFFVLKHVNSVAHPEDSYTVILRDGQDEERLKSPWRMWGKGHALHVLKDVESFNFTHDIHSALGKGRVHNSTRIYLLGGNQAALLQLAEGCKSTNTPFEIITEGAMTEQLGESGNLPTSLEYYSVLSSSAQDSQQETAIKDVFHQANGPQYIRMTVESEDPTRLYVHFDRVEFERKNAESEKRLHDFLDALNRSGIHKSLRIRWPEFVNERYAGRNLSILKRFTAGVRERSGFSPDAKAYLITPVGHSKTDAPVALLAADHRNRGRTIESFTLCLSAMKKGYLSGVVFHSYTPPGDRKPFTLLEEVLRKPNTFGFKLRKSKIRETLAHVATTTSTVLSICLNMNGDQLAGLFGLLHEESADLNVRWCRWLSDSEPGIKLDSKAHLNALIRGGVHPMTEQGNSTYNRAVEAPEFVDESLLPMLKSRYLWVSQVPKRCALQRTVKGGKIVAFDDSFNPIQVLDLEDNVILESMLIAAFAAVQRNDPSLGLTLYPMEAIAQSLDASCMWVEDPNGICKCHHSSNSRKFDLHEGSFSTTPEVLCSVQSESNARYIVADAKARGASDEEIDALEHQQKSVGFKYDWDSLCEHDVLVLGMFKTPSTDVSVIQKSVAKDQSSLDRMFKEGPLDLFHFGQYLLDSSVALQGHSFDEWRVVHRTPTNVDEMLENSATCLDTEATSEEFVYALPIQDTAKDRKVVVVRSADHRFSTACVDELTFVQWMAGAECVGSDESQFFFANKKVQRDDLFSQESSSDLRLFLSDEPTDFRAWLESRGRQYGRSLKSDFLRQRLLPFLIGVNTIESPLLVEELLDLALPFSPWYRPQRKNRSIFTDANGERIGERIHLFTAMRGLIESDDPIYRDVNPGAHLPQYACCNVGHHVSLLGSLEHQILLRETIQSIHSKA